MQTARGKSIVNGIAIGPLRVYRKQEMRLERASGKTPAQERARLQAACEQAGEQLAGLYEKALREAGEEAAAIFEIHRMMLEDAVYLDAARSMLETQRVTAEYAAYAAGEDFAAALAAAGDDYMQARAADIRDVSRRLVQILTGGDGAALPDGAPFILAAEDLTPSETMRLDRGRLLGLVTRGGSVHSHTAILARAMHIPALIETDFDDGWDGRQAILDGCGQCLYTDPTPELLRAMEEKRESMLRQEALLQELRGKPNVTRDGTEIEVCANIGSLADAQEALRQDAQGIGLFRSECICMNTPTYPSEEEQFALYRQVAETMAGRKVVIRTLDLGADKQAACFRLEREENPALGYRAIRISLTEREPFCQQLRAILRASAFGTVAVLFPMIISLGEVREAKALLEACREQLRARGAAIGTVEVGVMIETPAAAMIADELAREVDFFSIGTNDLTQYTLALDRQNARLERFYDPHHPAVLRMIRHTVEAGHRHGCRVSICGELGADASLTGTFLRMGVDELSVSPAAVLPLRGAIRSLDLRDAPGAGDA